MGFRNPLNLPPGSITGSLLAADAIDGKTITGAVIRTAAPPAKRWELDSVNHANQLRGYSGEANETAPGLVEIDSFADFASALFAAPNLGGATPVNGAYLYLTTDKTAGTPGAYSYLRSDYLYLQGRKDSTFGVLVNCSALGVTFDTTALGSGRPIKFLAGSGGVSTDGDLTVGGRLKTTDAVYSVAYSGTTDASGFLTVTHGAGFTPAGAWAMTGNPAGSAAMVHGIDSLTATTVRMRFTSTSAFGALASTAVAGRLFLVRP